MKLHRKFGQPSGRRPTSPRRMNWAGSRVRQDKHARGIIKWMALIHPDRVKRMITEQMYAQLERNGQLDTLIPNETPAK